MKKIDFLLDAIKKQDSYSLNNFLLSRLRNDSELDVNEVILIAYLKNSNLLDEKNLKKIKEMKYSKINKDEVINIIFLSSEELMVTISKYIIMIVSEDNDALEVVKEYEYVFLGLLFHSCQSYDLLMVSLLMNLLLLIKCESKLLEQTIEFIKWQEREDSYYSYLNPLLSSQNDINEKDIYNNYTIPNTFYCLMALESYTVRKLEGI